MITLRGELRCFSCSRFLGEFESHPDAHGKDDLHLLEARAGAPKVEVALMTERGLRCPRCGGRVVYDNLERLAA